MLGYRMSKGSKRSPKDNQKNPTTAEDEVLVEATLKGEDIAQEVVGDSTDEEPAVKESSPDGSPPEKESVELEEIPIAVEISDDPVRLYLKEIGRVELLEADQELWLAVRMDAYKKLQLLRTDRPARQTNVSVDTAVHRALFDELRSFRKYRDF